LAGQRSGALSATDGRLASLCSDTLIGPVSSPDVLQISLLFKNNSLLQTVGNFEKKASAAAAVSALADPKLGPKLMYFPVFSL
jgi:hypothetical protein